MNHRSKALWLPGLVSFTLSAGSLAILQTIAIHNRWFDASLSSGTGGRQGLLYVIWIVLQPICGALGAWLSKRAGGWRRETVTAGLFPSLVMLAVMLLVVVFAVFVERNPYITSHWMMFGKALAIWVMLPGVALLLGALPFTLAKPLPPMLQSF